MKQSQGFKSLRGCELDRTRMSRSRVAYLIILFGGLSASMAQSPAGGISVKTRQGVPFFPLGFYGIHHTQPLEDKLGSLQPLKDAGMNTVLQADAGVASGFSSVLDSAKVMGLHMIVATPHAPNILGTVRAYKNRSNILAWELADDADDGKDLEEMKARHDAVKAEDPSRPTYLSLTGWSQNRRERAAEYMPIADMVGYQIYPITPLQGYDVTSTNALLETYRRTRANVRAATSHNRPLLMNAQSFNWQGRYPTVLEERKMIYSGLAAGVKGLLWYDFSFDLIQRQPELWEELKALAADCRRLQPFLLEGRFQVLDSTADGGLAASSWVRNDSLLLVAVNTSYSASASVRIPIPQGFGDWMNNVASRFPQGLNREGGFVMGTLKPLEVQAYFLGRKTTSIVIGKGNAAYSQAADPGGLGYPWILKSHGIRDLLGRRPGEKGVGCVGK